MRSRDFLNRTETDAPLSFPLWVSFFFLSLAKILLVRAQHLTALGGALHDDRLFINIADALLNGKWLGTYHNLTLAKGLFYPIWIATVSKMGVPLLLSQHLLYIAACVTCVIAVKPLLRGPLIILTLFTVLLFNPMSYSQSIMTQVLREGIYPALTLLVVSCAVGVLVRSDRPLITVALWATGLGLTLSAFWLTREEGIWIVPSILLLVGSAAFRMWKTSPISWKSLSVMVLPFALLAVTIGGVAGMNKVRYDLFSVNELKSPDFLAAYGALLRVKHDEWKPTIPVPQDARDRIYKASPAFSELKPFLEGDLGKRWLGLFEGIRRLYEEDPEFAKKIRAVLDRDPTGIWSRALFNDSRDMLGGWFIWVFRDAVAAAGYHASGSTAADYYRRVATEVNAACSDGRLSCLGERSSLVPPWRNEYISPFLKTFVHGALSLVRFEGFTVVSEPSVGDDKSLKLLHDITHERLSPSEFQVKGWVFSPDRTIDISIRKANGTPLMRPIPYLPSPDVYEHFLSEGMDIPNARNARFDISLEPYKGMRFLYFESGARMITKIPLDGSITYLNTDGLHFNLNFIGLKGDTSKNDRARLRILGWIGKIYQSVMPLLAGLSLVAYMVSVLSMHKKRSAQGLLIVATSLFVALVARLVILSMIHVTSFPATTPPYFAPSYPLLILFSVLVLSDFFPKIQAIASHLIRGRGTQ